METTDEGWRRLFQLLAARTSAIFLYPGDSAGYGGGEVIRENDLLAKTIFIQPPGGTNSWEVEMEWGKFGRRWVKKALSSRNLIRKGVFLRSNLGARWTGLGSSYGDVKKLSNVIAELRVRKPKTFWPKWVKGDVIPEALKA